MPGSSPYGLFGFNQSSTELYVEWSSIPRDKVNGILLGYKIFYTRNSSRSENGSYPVWNVKEVRAQIDATALGGLDKFTWYIIHVAAFNSKGVGPKSAPIVLRTSEDGNDALVLFVM